MKRYNIPDVKIFKILIFSLFLTLININNIYTQNYGNWTSVAQMNIGRVHSASIVLSNGKVLVTGGEIDSSVSVTNTCELYDYQTNTWSFVANMNSERFYHQLTLIDSNRVLAIGGYRKKSCEIYYIKENIWTTTDSLYVPRLYGYTTTLLNDGRVVIVGGYFISEDSEYKIYLRDVEIYNPVTNLWSKTDSLKIGREFHTATLLENGNLLIAGGGGAGKECEKFDPLTEKWTTVDSLNESRFEHSAILLSDNKVLVSGGTDFSNPTNPWKNSCEVYDYNTDKWNMVTPMYNARNNHSSVFLINGQILFVGGNHGSDTWELYDIQTFQNVFWDYYPISKFYQNVEVLSNGNVINIGGFTGGDSSLPVISTTPMCELYSTLTSIERYLRSDISKIELFQNYPNPFNPETVISYQLSAVSFVKLKVFDLLGREITTLVDEEKPAGTYEVKFNANNLSSGIYFYTLITIAGRDNSVQTKKMILIH